ncbi:MAG: ribose-phosphate pyrophosphokinase [Muribaculaceae bacterium]|nr:ribose-phosphate pyrophosphokinase [Muribaculaceae bacterium]
MSTFKVFSGTKSRYVAEDIAHALGIELGKMNISHFADGEFEVCFEESVRGVDVYLVQSTFPNCDNLMELLLMIDAAKRASAKSVNAVIPYFGWARQDRKDKPRVSIASKLVADLLSAAGVTSILTMDLHADQIQGFFDVPVNHLYASTIFVPYIQSMNLENMVIASPDVGGAKRANSYAKYFDVPLVLCHKQRAAANVVDKMTIIGDVTDKNVIIIDDMIDTGGTICKAAQLMKDNGAKSVRALASHAVMSGNAAEKITNSVLDEVILTNSFPFDNSKCPKATILNVADLFAGTIKRVLNNESISSQYLFK